MADCSSSSSSSDLGSLRKRKFSEKDGDQQTQQAQSQEEMIIFTEDEIKCIEKHIDSNLEVKVQYRRAFCMNQDLVFLSKYYKQNKDKIHLPARPPPFLKPDMSMPGFKYSKDFIQSVKEQLHTKGWVRVKNVLSPQVVDMLKKHYYEWLDSDPQIKAKHKNLSPHGIFKHFQVHLHVFTCTHAYSLCACS